MSKKQEHSVPLSAELIQKYREGKLSAQEMHRIERMLLENPFYAEAMEGLEDQADLDTHMADLKERLAQRVSTPQKSIPMYRRSWQIAAAVALLAACSWIGYYFFTNSQNKPAEQMLSMKNEPEASSQQKPIPLEDAEEAQPKSQQPEATAPVGNPVASKKQKSESSVNEAISRAEEAELVEKETPPILSAPETLPPMPAQQPEMEADDQIAIAKVPEASAGNAYRSTHLLKSADAGAEVYGEGQSFYTLKGKVISGEDKMGVPGANVIIKNTATGIVTDVNGEFELPVPENQHEVVISSIGFQSVEKKVKETDSNLTVVLEPDIEALSEVVVVGYGAEDKKTATTITQAKPSVSYSSYKDYLKENLQYPRAAAANNIEGTVKVAFEVTPNGALQKFSIEKPLGHGCDEEAIRLIKEGPAWQPGLENEKPISQNVMVKVRFSLKD